MKDIADFMTMVERTDGPFLTKMPYLAIPKKIGEKNALGQTLVGWVEIDEGAVQAALQAWSAENERVKALYHDAGFVRSDDDDELWVPNLENYDDLESGLHKLWVAYRDANQRKPIYDPPTATMTMKWGMG